MRRIVWWGAFVGAAFWSLFAWIAYAVVDTVGTGAAHVGTVPGFPAEPFTFAWIAARLHGFGTSAVAVTWLAGVAMIIGFAALLHRLFAPRRPPALALRPAAWGSSIPSGQPVSAPPRDRTVGR